MLLILVGTLCFFANNHILTVAIPLLINDLDFDLSIIGYCTAAMGAVTIVAKFVTPSLMKHVRLKILLFADLAILALISFGFIVFRSPIAVFCLRTLFGAPFSLFPILNLVIIARISSDDSSLVKNTSLIGMAMPLSMMISPMITEYILAHYSYRAVFIAAFCSCLASLILYQTGLSLSTMDNASLSEERCPQKQSPKVFPTVKALLKPPLSRSLCIPILCFFFLGVVDMLLLTYYPLLATESGKTYSFFFILFSISMVVCQSAYHRIHIGDKSKLIAGYILLGLSVALASVSNTTFFYLCAVSSAVSFGIGYSLVETTTNTLVMAQSPNDTSAVFVTIQQLTICLGRTIGPWFISFFSGSEQQLRLCFLIVAASLALPIVLIGFVRKT
jgi:predicted MFS family arabinose efflux permease